MPPAAGKEYEGVLLENNSNLTSYYLSDMVDNGNPVAIANLAWARESTYTINPSFSLEYKLLGKEDESTQLNYTAEVNINAFTQNNASYYPHSLTSQKWSQGVDLTSDYELEAFRFHHASLAFVPSALRESEPFVPGARTF